MRYLKLFEAWVEEPKFFRFSHTELPEGQFIRDKQRTMIGPEKVNDELVKKGFPDKKNCIHFMSENAVDLPMRGIWGNFVYEVKIDNRSIIGWTFLLNINDWYFKANKYNYYKNEPIIRQLEESPFGEMFMNDGSFDEDRSDDEQVGQMTEELMKVGAIGFGTIEDLKKSPWYNKYKYYCWTTDKVFLTKYEEPKKEPKAHKKIRVLTKEHFIDGQEMGKFYREKGTEIENMDLPSALEVLEDWRRENS